MEWKSFTNSGLLGRNSIRFSYVGDGIGKSNEVVCKFPIPVIEDLGYKREQKLNFIFCFGKSRFITRLIPSEEGCVFRKKNSYFVAEFAHRAGTPRPKRRSSPSYIIPLNYSIKKDTGLGLNILEIIWDRTDWVVEEA